MIRLNGTSLIEDLSSTSDLIRDIKNNPNVSYFDYFDTFLKLIILIVVVWTRARVLKTPLRDVLRSLTKRDLKKNEEIENILLELLWTSKADRVCVGLLHNGLTAGNIHFDKISVMYEVTRPNITSIKPTIQNINISVIYKHLIDSSALQFIKYSRDEAIDSSYSKFLDYMGINTVYSRLLINSKKSTANKEDKPIYGIVELYYINDTEENLYSENKVRELDILYNKLSTCLERHIKDKRYKVQE